MLSSSNVRLKNSDGAPCVSGVWFEAIEDGMAWLKVCASFSGLYWNVKKMFFEEIVESLASGASRIRVPLLMLGWLGKSWDLGDSMFLWVQPRLCLFPSLHAQ